jgi:Uma2 family endonuclease
MASIQQDTGSLGFVVAKPQASERMSEEEFVAWCGEDTRAEWAEGEVIVMSPVSISHNRLTRFLHSLLQEYVDERDLGEAFGTEVSARINSKRRRLPDVFFVSKSRFAQLHENHFEGPPNLIIEVVSNDSVDRDWRVKYLEYEAAGVDEYWVIDPLHQRIEAYSLGDDRTYRSMASLEGKIASRVVPGFYLRSDWLWQERPPKVPVVLNELLGRQCV